MSTSQINCEFNNPRLVVKTFLAEAQREGDGATVRRSIGSAELKNFDPFLLLDDFSVSKPAGFPDHPHRGFETVTYMLQGALAHQDFAGHKGVIGTLDVQWMTAGRGIVHSEMPVGDGVNRGLQLWINLASKDKMIEPNYQELKRAYIARAEKGSVDVEIIAGESMGVQSPIYTRTPTMYLYFTLHPGEQFAQPIPESFNAFVYVVDGEGVFGESNSEPILEYHCAVLGPGNGLCVWNHHWDDSVSFVLIAGQPINEPLVQHGPSVMNTQAEIEKTLEDYQLCKNGFEMAKFWRSQ